jgi:hypothetical protein
MTSRPLILATVLVFVNGCDYSQKTPQTAPAVLASGGPNLAAVLPAGQNGPCSLDGVA